MAFDPNRVECVGDLVSLQRGTTYKSKLLGFPGPTLLGLASIERGGGFRSDNLKTYGGESPEKLLLRPGDLFVSLKDVTQAAHLLGAVARVPEGILGRLTQDTVKLQMPEVPADWKSYLYWILRTSEYRAYCKANSMGTTNLSLSRDDFLAFPVPPLSVERKVVLSTLESIEFRIDNNRALAANLEAIARALFQSWFVDFDPARAKAAGETPPSLAPDLAALFPDRFVDSELGEIPEGWNAATLADVCSLNPESWTGRKHPEQIEYVDLANVKAGEVENRASYSWEESPSRARRVLRAGDTIVGTVRPGNRSFALIAEDGLTGSTGFAALRPKESLNIPRAIESWAVNLGRSR